MRHCLNTHFYMFCSSPIILDLFVQTCICCHVQLVFLFIPTGRLSRAVIGRRLFDAKYKSAPNGCEPGPTSPPCPNPNPPAPTPTPPPVANPSLCCATSREPEVWRAEREHLDHTSKFYFLMADRRTRRTVAANLPLPPPPPPPPLIPVGQQKKKKKKTCITVKKQKA